MAFYSCGLSFSQMETKYSTLHHVKIGPSHVKSTCSYTFLGWMAIFTCELHFVNI